MEFMRAKFVEVRSMEKEVIYGIMVTFIMVHGNMELLMDMEHSFMLMVEYLKAISIMANSMG